MRTTYLRFLLSTFIKGMSMQNFSFVDPPPQETNSLFTGKKKHNFLLHLVLKTKC